MSFRSLLRPVRRLVAGAVESIWTLGFKTVSRLGHLHADRWASSGGQLILIVAPHPDDEAIGCVGTVLRHLESGDRVSVAIATDGRRSRAISDPIEMAALRRREATDAARLMRISRLEWLGLAEGEWSIATLHHALRTLIEDIKPDIIYAPSRIDFHPEHFRVAHSLALALADLDVGCRMRIYQIQVPLTSILCNLVTDVSGVVRQCESVLRTYASQAGSVDRTYRLRRYSAGSHGMTELAEEFWEMTSRGYIALHCAPPDEWPNGFRGLRYLPFTDPMAYIQGKLERRRVKTVAEVAQGAS